MDETHDRLKELVAPYVLGAVPQNEMAFVRAHILSCDECMTEADSFAQVTEKLPLMINPVALPEGFAERVLAAAGPEAQDQMVSETEARIDGGKVVSLEARRRTPLISILAAAAVLLAFAVMTTSLLQTRGELQRQEVAVGALLRAGDDAMGLQGSSGAVAKMVPSNGDQSSLVVAGLGSAPHNHVYQLWIQRDGEMQSGGIFDVEEGVAVVPTDWALDEYQAAAITIEPAGGSPQPTSQPILASFPL